MWLVIGAVIGAAVGVLGTLFVDEIGTLRQRQQIARVLVAEARMNDKFLSECIESAERTVTLPLRCREERQRYNGIPNIGVLPTAHIRLLAETYAASTALEEDSGTFLQLVRDLVRDHFSQLVKNPPPGLDLIVESMGEQTLTMSAVRGYSRAFLVTAERRVNWKGLIAALEQDARAVWWLNWFGD